MKKNNLSELYKIGLLLCFIPWAISALFFLNQLFKSSEILNSCLAEKSYISVEKDCHACCQDQLWFKSRYLIKRTNMLFSDSDTMNILWSSLHGISAYFLLLFSTPLLLLLAGARENEVFFLKAGAAATFILYAGLISMFSYAIFTFKDS